MNEVNNRNRRRWGIIYSPMIGALRPMKRWKEIREYLAEKEIEYDFYRADNEADAERQSLKYANEGYGILLLIGGDGLIQDALNGVMASERAGEIAVGIVPNGIANDFVKWFAPIDAEDTKVNYLNRINTAFDRIIQIFSLCDSETDTPEALDEQDAAKKLKKSILISKWKKAVE